MNAPSESRHRPADLAASLRFAAGALRAGPTFAGEGGDDDDRRPGGTNADLAVATKPKSKRPSMYKVLLLNDDYTPMEFVVEILERFFGIRHESAVEIMLTVHRRGLAVVGVFSFEIAETKVTQVMEYAQMHQHPLQCTMEKE